MQPPTRSSTRKTWCGPYALALISGLPYDAVYDMCRVLLMRKRIAGMSNFEVEFVCRNKAFKASKLHFVDPDDRPTLARMTDHLVGRRLYIVNITGHYVVVNTADWTVCCNQSAAWEPLAGHKFARRRVVSLAEARKLAA